MIIEKEVKNAGGPQGGREERRGAPPFSFLLFCSYNIALWES